MKRPVTAGLGLMVLLGACAGNGQANKATAEAPQQEEVVQQASESRQAPEVTKERAERLAQTHLALRKVSWGAPKEIVEQDEQFLVYYETPERELRLLGQRALIVEKGSGLVSYQKRR